MSVFTNTLKIKRYYYTNKTLHLSVNQIFSNFSVLEPSQTNKQQQQPQNKIRNEAKNFRVLGKIAFVKSMSPED